MAFDNQEKKLRDFAKLAKRFMKVSGRLVDAANEKSKYSFGSRGHQRASVRYQFRERQYDELAVQMEKAIEVFD